VGGAVGVLDVGVDVGMEVGDVVGVAVDGADVGMAIGGVVGVAVEGVGVGALDGARVVGDVGAGGCIEGCMLGTAEIWAVGVTVEGVAVEGVNVEGAAVEGMTVLGVSVVGSAVVSSGTGVNISLATRLVPPPIYGTKEVIGAFGPLYPPM
jgi:hypothetical protein